MYTPVNGLATGGHFLMYGTMVQTMLGRLSKHDLGRDLIDSDHLDVEYSLVVMVCALPHRPTSRGESPTPRWIVYLRPDNFVSAFQSQLYGSRRASP
jgi:hypothetical protein